MKNNNITYINIKMYIQLNVKMLDQNQLVQVNTCDLVYQIKDTLKIKYAINDSFNLYFKGNKLYDYNTLNQYDICHADTVHVLFDNGYIFIETMNKTDRVLIKLDNMNNINETVIDLKRYLDKIYQNYYLKFNDIILENEYNNLKLSQIGIKFNLKQNDQNTLHLVIS